MTVCSFKARSTATQCNYIHFSRGFFAMVGTDYNCLVVFE